MPLPPRVTDCVLKVGSALEGDNRIFRCLQSLFLVCLTLFKLFQHKRLVRYKTICMCSNTADPPRCPIDVVIALDESSSIGTANFELVKSFLSQLVGLLDIDNNNTRVGLVTYATNVGTSFNLDVYSSVASVQSAISSLAYSGGNTYTNEALAYVRTIMLTSAAGDRVNVPNVVVVLTDGVSSDPTATLVSDQPNVTEL